MKFDIEASINKITAPRTNADRLEEVAQIVKNAFNDTVLSDEFRKGIISVYEKTRAMGVKELGSIELIKDVHHYLLEVGRTAVEEHLGNLAHEKRVLAEILIEKVIGEALFKLGALTNEDEGRLMGLDQHPEFSMRKYIGKISGNRVGIPLEAYPQMTTNELARFNEILLVRAREGGLEWGELSSTEKLEQFLYGIERSVNFFSHPNFKASDMLIWPLEMGQEIDQYLVATAEKRLNIETQHPKIEHVGDLSETRSSLEPQEFNRQPETGVSDTEIPRKRLGWKGKW